MGNTSSNSNRSAASSSSSSSSFAHKGWYKIKDKYVSIEDVVAGMRDAGLESSNLILGIDFTKSNEWNGKRSFQGRNLHAQSPHEANPYESVIDIISRSLSPFDDDHMYPVYGFGDTTTSGRDVMSFGLNDQPIHGSTNVLAAYKAIIPHVRLAGPTTFGPLIRKAIDICDENGEYHILVIIADGQVTRPSSIPKGHVSQFEQDTIDAIVEASNYPLSIIMVGVGDGPWDMMKEFDDSLPKRRFDNFQFVNFSQVRQSSRDIRRREANFSLAALQEIPEQYCLIQQLGLLGQSNQRRRPPQVVKPPPDAAINALRNIAAAPAVATAQIPTASTTGVPVATAHAVPVFHPQ